MIKESEKRDSELNDFFEIGEVLFDQLFAIYS